ncbi:endonuclease MutS2 [Jonquetella sp. BV3C21]|uniref:endonuclease MutS2 n=1 Tax=Jonquetella sp. BV3C21 TaxID=1111126 RepID=UPI0003ADCBCE|nr:Smr/MutS family protein [Jonquetella sp. BV3C21]ERL24350.1 MutS2 family protein [Jonquetella sp. BV3C21]
MNLSEQTAQTLELPDVLALFGRKARSELALKALAHLSPASSVEELRTRQNALKSYADCQAKRGELPWLSDVKLAAYLLDEAKETGWVDGPQLLTIRRLLELSQKIKEFLDSTKEDWPELKALCGRIRDFTEEIRRLAVLDDSGELLDGASPRLRDLRTKLENAKSQARTRGNRFLNGPQSHMLQEKILTLRNGRFSVLVKPGSVPSFPGIFTERSLSGNSAYMEPQSIVPLNNQIADLNQQIKEEERTIFRELTGLLLARQGAIRAAEDVLCQLDLCHCALEWMSGAKWRLAELQAPCHFRFYQLRHPLLGSGAVPIDVACGLKYRQLVVTGPNTGGKTVALKTAAVAVYLSWCGLPAPCGDGSTIGPIDGIYADIGDEQSIEQNLSTFSSHLTRIVQALEKATKNSLVLLDELGAGTDPQEGSALGIALLEEFGKRGSLVLATTHHNPIKHYATVTAGVEASCVDFDEKSLKPTYRLLTGVPGQSNALAIAGRYGMPQNILSRARQLLNEREVDAERLMGELQTKKSQLDRIEREVIQRQTELQTAQTQIEARRKALFSQKDDVLLKAQQQARQVLDEAEQQARDLLRNLQDAAESAGHKVMEDHKKQTKAARLRGAVREASIEARKNAALSQEKPLAVGDSVRIGADGKAIGEIVALSENNAEVQMGMMKVSVPVRRLVRTKRPKEESFASGPKFTKPEGVAGSLMVRGLSLDEAMPLVSQYLDRAMRAGYGEVTIIHGRGEGILRRAVHELCASLNYVSEYRLGGPGEGGYGVTIVRFK